MVGTGAARAEAPHHPTAVLVPDESSGPVLVVAGTGVMLAGWSVATAGVAIDDCMVTDYEGTPSASDPSYDLCS
jgi:hypothetical protein